jgi:hypothetical protein
VAYFNVFCSNNLNNINNLNNLIMKKNIKQNMLSLKSLQQELEALKSAQQVHNNNHPHTDVAGHDIKGSYINRIYMKSSSVLLFLLSGLLSYGHRLPFIGKIVTILSLWYGRTTWWRILIQLRKVFVVFNALIGVYVVFKSIGFSTDNILAGVAGLGHQYIEIFSSFTSRLFNWFVELFDHKVVPNTPNNPSDGSWNKWNPLKQIGWNTKPMHDNGIGKMMDLAKSQDFYKSPINLSVNTSTSWYKDLGTWLWLGGIACGIGLLYFGYKFLMDPTFISELGRDNTTTAQDIVPDINITEASSNNTISDLTNRFISKLNPFNYFTNASELNRQYRSFMEQQYRLETADRTLYPFTDVNPYMTWSQRVKTYIFGESAHDSLQRLKDRLYADRAYTSLMVNPNGQTTEIVGGNTPMPIVSTLGLGISHTPSGHSFWDSIHIANKLHSIPNTPNSIPLLPDVELQDISQWNTHVREPYDYNNIASSSKITTELLDGYLGETIFDVESDIFE